MKTKKGSEKVNNIPDSFLLLATKEISARELMNIINEKFKYEIELWEEIGILEIIVGEKVSIDVEEFEIDSRDELLLNEASQVGAKSFFCFSGPAEIYDDTRKVLLYLKETIGGAVVADTADLRPIL